MPFIQITIAEAHDAATKRAPYSGGACRRGGRRNA